MVDDTPPGLAAAVGNHIPRPSNTGPPNTGPPHTGMMPRHADGC